MKTDVRDNTFSRVLFQLQDPNTGDFILNFGVSEQTGVCSGAYIHEYPSGLYTVAFKTYSDKRDEGIFALMYIEQGETMHYSYEVDQFASDYIVVSGLQIAGE